jgi:hypothetical protein
MTNTTGRARIADALIQGAYGTGRNQPMLNLNYGGQYGYATEPSEWVSTTHYVSRNLIVRLLDAPAGFNYLPEPQKWIQSCKMLFERHAKTIEGFNQTLEGSFAETAIGGAGEKFHDLTNVTRTASDMVTTHTDLYGRPIQNFIHDWITILGMNPETKFPDVLTLNGNGNTPTDLLHDISHATLIVFEPDPSHTKVAKAWLHVNVFPKGTGEISAKRDLTAEGSLSELSINWTGFSLTGFGVTAFAQQILNTMNLKNANPLYRPSFVNSIHPDVHLDGSGSGYAEQISKIAKEVGSRVAT